MPQIVCPGCGNEVSSRLIACPECGLPVRYRPTPADLAVAEAARSSGRPVIDDRPPLPNLSLPPLPPSTAGGHEFELTAFSVIGWTVVWLAFVGIVVGLYLSALSTARESDSWPSVQGVIEESKTIGGGEDSEDVAKYSYTVNGRQYKSSRIRIAASGLINANRPSNVRDRFPVGREVAVYFDPADPSSAVLEPGTHGIVVTMLLTIGIPTAVGLVAVYKAVNRERS